MKYRVTYNTKQSAKRKTSPPKQTPVAYLTKAMSLPEKHLPQMELRLARISEENDNEEWEDDDDLNEFDDYGDISSDGS